jgi:hypothetical protein
MNKEIKTDEDYYLLLFQSEFSNLISTKEMTSEIFYSLIEGMDETTLKNNEFMDLYLSEYLFSTLLPGLESLSKNVEKLMFFSHKEDEREINRFNPCNYLGEFLMRNNPRYGKNLELNEKFLIYTRKERKKRMITKHESNMFEKVTFFYKKENINLNKTNIVKFVENMDIELKMNDQLHNYNWVEHFRKYKDNEEISLDKFLDAFRVAVLDLHEINEAMIQSLLK